MANASKTNIALWNNLAPVDRKFTKPITGKSYKGDSPNPTYIIWKLTQELGPLGIYWGFNVKFDRVREGKPHQIITTQEQTFYDQPNEDGTPRIKSKSVGYHIIREEYHEVCVTFWFQPEGVKEPRTFDAFGGTPMLYMTNSGKWMHDEDAAKKSLTDAYTKGASWLGACADIFLGIFDDKYTSQPENPQSGKAAPEQQTPSPQPDDSANPDSPAPMGEPKQPDTQRQNSAPAGW